MTKPKFTPGPWDVTCAYVEGNVYRLWDTDGNYPADCSADAMNDNARLIAAAPELYVALKSALSSYREQWIHPGTDKKPHLLPAPAWVLQARAALAKVEGGNDA